MAFLAASFTDLGFDRAEAQQRAVIAYGAYLGLFVVWAGNPDAGWERSV